MPNRERTDIAFELNGRSVEVACHPLTRLLDVLRVNLGLTGTKEGCGEGECGACSVIVDGAVVNSCLVPAAQVVGCRVETVEGLVAHREGRALQAAFIAHGGAQCGICTPGMLVAATCLLRRRDRPTPAEIREQLAGNLCRCTGYVRIVESVDAAAVALVDGREEPSS